MISDAFDTFSSSAFLVAVSEIGDKTQLLSFSLAAKYRTPMPILAGILVATLANHTMAAWAGATVASFFHATTVAWFLGVIFIVCAAWALVPDTLDSDEKISKKSAFVNTVILFFLAEMGDKTQVATMGLGAHYLNVFWVAVGTTTGMMITDGFAVFLGQKLASKVQAKWIRYAAAILFLAFGIGSIFDAIKNS